MPSTSRRAFLASAALAAASGCTALGSSPRPAHTVTVYLSDRDATRDVSVSVTDESDNVLLQRDYRLSDDNEADEDAAFPESTEPSTVVVTVDGTRFERDWPGIENPQLPCEGDNWAGVEIWIEGGPDESPDVRVETTCQHVTME